MPWTKIYGNRAEFDKASAGTDARMRGITYREAILESTAQLMETDESVFVIGEGVDDGGGVFGTTLGLKERFGPLRVMDSPLAENGITGVTVGAAVAGMRPILVHMRVDFLPLTFDQLMNHAAKWHYMFGGRAKVPLVIRCIIGRGWGSAAQHSQSLHSLFAHVPGLRVLMPASPYDAKGLLRAAVYDNNPAIIIEHRWLYEHVGHVPMEQYSVEIGKGVVRREGRDATIVAVSYMAHVAMLAAVELMKEGIDVTVIDPRTIKPLDTDIIIDSVRKTGRLVTVDTGWRDCSIGSEIIARVTEEAFGALKSAPVRINLPDAPTPASPILEKAYYPGQGEIIAAVKKTIG